MLDLPIAELNLRLDTVDDSAYDYYERDRNAGLECKGGVGGHRRPYDEGVGPFVQGYQYRDHHYDFNRRVGYQGQSKPKPSLKVLQNDNRQKWLRVSKKYC